MTVSAETVKGKGESSLERLKSASAAISVF